MIFYSSAPFLPKTAHLVWTAFLTCFQFSSQEYRTFIDTIISAINFCSMLTSHAVVFFKAKALVSIISAFHANISTFKKNRHNFRHHFRKIQALPSGVFRCHCQEHNPAKAWAMCKWTQQRPTMRQQCCVLLRPCCSVCKRI